MKTTLILLLALVVAGCSSAAPIQQNSWTTSVPAIPTNQFTASHGNLPYNAGDLTNLNGSKVVGAVPLATSATTATTAGSATTATTATTANALGGNPPAFYLSTNAVYGLGTLVLTWNGTNYILDTNTVTGVFNTNTVGAGVVLITTNTGGYGVTLWIGTATSTTNVEVLPLYGTFTNVASTNGVATYGTQVIAPGESGTYLTSITNTLAVDVQLIGVSILASSGSNALWTNPITGWGVSLPTNYPNTFTLTLQPGDELLNPGAPHTVQIFYQTNRVL